MTAKRLRDAAVVKKTTRQLATALFARTFFARIVLKATRGHRNVLIENLQAQDVEELMHRPAMCTKKYHENEPLDYYCQDCSVCICHRCSIVSHNRNTLVDLQEAAEQQKMQMTQVFAKVKEKLVIVESKISKQTELMTKSEKKSAPLKRMLRKLCRKSFELRRNMKRLYKLSWQKLKLPNKGITQQK